MPNISFTSLLNSVRSSDKLGVVTGLTPATVAPALTSLFILRKAGNDILVALLSKTNTR